MTTLKTKELEAMYSTRTIADALGVSPRSVGRYLNGERGIGNVEPVKYEFAKIGDAHNSRIRVPQSVANEILTLMGCPTLDRQVPEQDALSVADVAKLMDAPQNWVHRLIRSGQLPAAKTKLKNKFWIHRKNVAKLIEEGMVD